MFRGFLWQLLVFLVAFLCFVAALVYRVSQPPTPAPTASPAAPITATASPAAPATTPPPNAAASAAPRAIYREAIVGGIQRLNPLFAHLNPADSAISRLIFESLFTINDYGELRPQLAAELVISNDGLEYVVRLRDDIVWQDGLPFTAEDVFYTMSLLSAPGYERFSPTAAFWQTVETQKLSDSLLRFRLAQPFASFPQLLTIGILPEHALRGTPIEQLAGHPFNLSPIGTGAYQLAALQTAADGHISALQLARSPLYQARPEAQDGYWLRDLQFSFFSDAAAAIDAYLNGQADAIANSAPRAQLLALPQSRIYTQVEAALSLLIFNWRDSPFAERRLRQTLSLALDAPSLIQRHFGAAATYADSPYIAGAAVYQPHSFWTRYDLAQAHLEAADVFASTAESADEASADSKPAPRFSLLIEDRPPLPALARDIAASWAGLGLEVTVEAVGAAALKNRLEAGDFEAAIVRQRIGADSDLFQFWHPAQATDGQNYGAAANNEIAEALELARAEIYDLRRYHYYQDFQESFAEQAIAIPLYYPLYTFVARDSIEGIQLSYLASAADRFRNIKNWRPATGSS